MTLKIVAIETALAREIYEILQGVRIHHYIKSRYTWGIRHRAYPAIIVDASARDNTVNWDDSHFRDRSQLGPEFPYRLQLRIDEVGDVQFPRMERAPSVDQLPIILQYILGILRDKHRS